MAHAPRAGRRVPLRRCFEGREFVRANCNFSDVAAERRDPQIPVVDRPHKSPSMDADRTTRPTGVGALKKS
jgi:hypothetical protein